MNEIKKGAERGEQLWDFAKTTADPEALMRANLSNAIAKVDHLVDQWREANAEVATLRYIMREAGYDARG